LIELEEMPASQADADRLYSPAFILMWIANFFVVTSMSAFFLFPLFILDHGGGESDIGVLMGAMMLSSVLIRPWISQMIDHFGRKRCYFLGTAILAFMPFLYLFFDGSISDFYLPLFLVRIVHGFGVAFGFAASFTYVIDIIPQKRLNEGLGMFGVTALVGMATGPAIAEPVLATFGFTGYFLSISMLSLISLFLQLFLPETFVPGAPTGEKITFFMVLKRRKVFGVALLALVFGTGMATQGGFVAPYVAQIGLPNVSIFFVAFSLTAVVIRVFGAKLADRVGEERIIPWAFLVSASGFLMLATVDRSWLLMVSGIVIGCGHGFIFPCLNALINRDEPPHIRGKIAGIFTGGMDLGMFIGSIIMGYIGEWLGYWQIFVTASLMLCFGTILFFTVLGKILHPPGQQPPA